MTPKQTLEKYFGHTQFRDGQKEIIDTIISGKNVLAVLPTGAGKSVCYQIPALVSPNFSIVVSPLIALMKDQVDSLNSKEEVAAYINSTMNIHEIDIVLQNISFGKIKLLYVSPERMENVGFAERIKSLNPNFLFIDEAHCISEWGHNFRPSYLKIKDFIKYTGIKRISCFTATATPEVRDDIINQLILKDCKLFVRGFERKNLNLNVITSVTRGKKKQKVLELLKNNKTPALVYTSLRKTAEEVAEFLILNRVNCAYYHAGLNNIERKKIQEDFQNNKLSVLVCTNAFGMGIDKKDIRLIIHYNLPGTVENYYQEIGRAGRDGKQSFIFLLHDDSDVKTQKFFIGNSFPDKKLIHTVYNAICDYNKIAVGIKPEKSLVVNTEYISNYNKKKLTYSLIHSSLKLLENNGYIRILSSFENKPTLKFTCGPESLRNFVKNLSDNILREIILYFIREYGGGIFTKSIKIDLNKLSQNMGLEVDEINKLLDSLNNFGYAEYYNSNNSGKDNIVLTVPRVSPDGLLLNYKRINELYLLQQRKLDEMVNYAYTNECRFKFILNYFGDKHEDYTCGKCDNCTGQSQLAGSSTYIDYLKELILKTIYFIKENATENIVINVLKGNNSYNQYRNLETFQSCVNHTKKEIKSVFIDLIHNKYIEKNLSNNKIHLTSKGNDELLKANLIDVDSKKNLTKDYEKALELFNLLREEREKVSKKFVQANYLICPDDVLRKIAETAPKSKEDLLAVSGFTKRMYNKVGVEFLNIIKQDSEKGLDKKTENHKKDLPKNISETYKLILKGYSLNDIASLRNLSEAVISMQIETILQFEPTLDIIKIINLETLERISDEIKNGFTDLKELKSKLPIHISYAEIRIALAKFRFNEASSLS